MAKNRRGAGTTPDQMNANCWPKGWCCCQLDFYKAGILSVLKSAGWVLTIVAVVVAVKCTEVGQVWNRLSLKDTSWEVFKKRFNTQRYFQCDIFSLFSQRINMNICFVICFEGLLIKDICCSKRLLNNNWWWHLPASLPRTNLARVCGFSLNSAICFGILHFFDF